ncbi:MAG: amino acid adenylation domain-containing protein [Candidatus Aminicenantes bacterium]|nr:amino acid adenylation domain-containing protein [Candidatus Aminicenantes bacterium]
MNRNITLQLISGTSQFDKEKNYWLNKFSGEIVKSSLHYDQPGKDEHDFSRETGEFTIPQELASKLSHFSNRSDNNLFVFLAAAVTILLHRYTGNDDIIAGCPILKQETEGNFLNTMMALRNRLNPGMTFKDLLLQVKQTFNEANDNSNYPLQRLLYHLGLPQEETGFPLFETVIMLQNIHERNYFVGMHHNIVWVFRRDGQRIDGVLEYNSALFEKEIVARIASHLVNILENSLKDINIPLSEIEILSKNEQRLLLEEFNGTDAAIPGDKVYHELFEEQAARTPDQIALLSVRVVGRVGPVGQVRLSYGELNEQSNRLARFLAQKGVGPDIIVGIAASPSLEMVVGIMAILKAGGAYLPIDHESPRDRMEYLLHESACNILLTQSFLSPTIDFRGEKIPIDDESLYTGDPSNLEKSSGPDNLFYTIYTSGTTGRPKGALLTHRNIVNYVTWFCRTAELTDRDRTVTVSSFAFDIGYTTFLSSLVTGGRLHLAAKETYIEPGALLAYIKENSISYLKMTPSLFSVLVSSPGFPGGACETLRLVVLGGEAIDVHDIEKAHREYGHIQIINHYGPTETTIGCAAQYVDFRHFEEFKKNPTIGNPVNNVQVYILDRYLRLAPVGVPGELFIGGAGVARGYLNNPELTAEKFKFNRSYRSYKTNIFYKTGDLARWLPGGNIEFLGRQDGQVKIRGFRVELGEIENQIIKHESIADGVVVVHEKNKENKGTGKYLCAYIVLVPGQESFNVAQLREFLSGSLPEYMIPAYFVEIDRIPLTPNGKLDKKALPLPVFKKRAEHIAARDEVEERMAALWAESLQVEKEVIGINGNFFELGGNSLSAAILAAKIHTVFDVNFPMVKIFERPTVEALAEYIKGASTAVPVTIPPAEEKEYYPLSPAQERLTVYRQMECETTAVNLFEAVELEGELDLEKLEEVFKELIDRHESLRTSFPEIGNKQVQRIHDKVGFEIEKFDLAAKNAKNREEIHHSSFIIHHFIRAFDLSKAPLLRVGLIRSGLKSILMIDMHHIIADGVSHRVLLDEVIQLYRGERLPRLKIRYRDYSEWRRSRAVRESLREQEEYWLREYAGETPQLNIPTDYARPEVRSFEGSFVIFAMGEEETVALNKLAASEGVTLFMVLLALYGIFLAKLSRQGDIVIGTPVPGRRHPGLERIIGMFANTLALRIRPSGEMRFTDFLKEVKEKILKAFENQDYQFEELVEKAALKTPIGRNPLFDVMFALQSAHDAAAALPVVKTGALKIKPYAYEHRVVRRDLTLIAVESGNGLEFRLEYCTALFCDETAARYINHFKEIISSVLANPAKKLMEIIRGK